MAWTKDCLMRRLNISSEDAEKILAVSREKTAPESYETVLHWSAKCYNRPSLSELKMYAFNEILAGHGIEGGCVLNGDACDFSYVNMGDPYIPTIIHDAENGKFLVMGWGDFIELKERAE